MTEPKIDRTRVDRHVRKEPGDAVKSDFESGPLEAGSNWQPMALTASVLLAVFSTGMFWKVSNEAGELERELAELSQPMNGVLRINVDIMRSASSEVPGLIIQKPGPLQMIQFDIELTPQASEFAEINLALLDAAGETVVAWKESGGKRGRVVALLRSTVVPDGRVHLEISDNDGNLIDRRLLEFRPDD